MDNGDRESISKGITKLERMSLIIFNYKTLSELQKINFNVSFKSEHPSLRVRNCYNSTLRF